MSVTPSPSPSRIAVAIACYNQGEFVAEAIRSVLDQERAADEIILVDDGSTDTTAAVARGFPQVRYYHQANAGLSAARNAGLAATHAERILFLDADDLLLPTALAAAERCIERNDQLAFVYGSYARVDRDRHRLSRHPAQPTAAPFLDLLRGNFIAMHGTVLYDAARLRAAGGFDPQLRSCEDYDVYLRLARDHPIAAYDAIAAEYRQHGAGLTGNAPRMIATSRAVIHRHARPVRHDPAARAAAAAGLATMTGHFARTAVRSLADAARERRLRATLVRLGRDALRDRNAILPLLTSVVRQGFRKLVSRRQQR